MTLFLSIVAFIMWTLLILIAGYKSGKDQGKKEANELGSATNNFTFSGSGLSEEDIQTIADRVLDSVPPPFCEFTKEKQDQLALLIAANQKKENEGGLTARMTSAESRLTRVERKAGMSV